MIITVTMNPALDKTVEVERLTRGALNRIRRFELDAGGKGVNVSKTIHALGGKSIAAAVLAGSSGRTLADMLEADGIAGDYLWVSGETRTNTKVVEPDGTLTELNEPGPQLDGQETEAFLEKLDRYAKEDTLFVLSGSVPAGVSADIYARIIRRVHEKGAKVLLDADGEVFARAVEAAPEMVKPNRAEIEAYAKQQHMVRTANAGDAFSTEELFSAADLLAQKGVKKAVISLGGEGALFSFGSFRAVCPALPIAVRSVVGAGDAMAAALACAWETGLSAPETVRLCMAAAAGAAQTPGTRPPTAKEVNRLKDAVIF